MSYYKSEEALLSIGKPYKCIQSMKVTTVMKPPHNDNGNSKA